MTDTRLDIIAIGNAIVDVIAPADDAFITSEGIEKGSMRLIDTEIATSLYGRMAPGLEASGGSAARAVRNPRAMIFAWERMASRWRPLRKTIRSSAARSLGDLR